jgi:hypothetical protein
LLYIVSYKTNIAFVGYVSHKSRIAPCYTEHPVKTMQLYVTERVPKPRADITSHVPCGVGNHYMMMQSESEALETSGQYRGQQSAI